MHAKTAQHVPPSATLAVDEPIARPGEGGPRQSSNGKFTQKLEDGLLSTHKKVTRIAGLLVVASFGIATIVFGLSRSLPLSLAMLAITGFVDMISMNIRATTVAVLTPLSLQGRVGAVEWVFISASNELGAFESGASAALLGTVRAVVLGGVLMVGFAAAWPRLFPALSRLGPLDELEPEPV